MQQNSILAGTYIDKKVIHVQYISANQEGKEYRGFRYVI
jgi:hypothetical protein